MLHKPCTGWLSPDTHRRLFAYFKATGEATDLLSSPAEAEREGGDSFY